MSIISLDPEQAEQTAEAFNRCCTSIEDELNTMLRSTRNVLSTWQGQSRNQFEEQWQEHYRLIREITEEIERLSAELRTNAHDFREAARRFA